MRNAILQELHAEYEQQRAENERQNALRRAEAVRACPEIELLLNARQEMIFASLRGILGGQVTADDLPQRMEVMNRQLASLLNRHGFAEDYLEPVFRCKRCEDTGYVGEPVREQCECLRTAFFTRLYQRVGLGEQAQQSFERFDLSIFSDEKLPGKTYSQRELMEMLRQQCAAWAEQYPCADVPNLLLMGQSGLGKTYLMHAMAKVLLQRGVHVMMISAYQFLETARKAYFSGKQEEMDTLIEADVLMIDDMGSEPLMENITIVQWFNLINERQLRGKATVISTNLMEDELRRRYTERIASRLLDRTQCRLLQFLGDDVRRRKA
ncbi:MAG: ATP-binding protein [Clostridia bacterium]|nr:ATP-binding protein [Clostridia bacterium]